MYRSCGSVWPMSLREDILSASSEGELLEVVADTPYSDQERVAELLAEMHNAGELNLFDACESDQLCTLSRHRFFDLQAICCVALPLVRCATEDAVALCDRFSNQAGEDLSAGSVYGALREWFTRSIERVEEGLTFIRANEDVPYGVTSSLLLAGSTHDVARFVQVALELSQEPNEHTRRAALSTMGVITPAEEVLTCKVLERLQEAIGSHAVEQDQIAALNAGLDLLERLGDAELANFQQLVVSACRDPGPMLRHAIAEGLRDRRSVFTDTMTDAAFAAIGDTDCDYARTISAVDSMLYRWDIEGDRKRVLSLLVELIGRDEKAIDVQSLPNFRHRIANGPGALLGWYVVSLFLTGNDKLSVAADDLLPYQETRDGLDIDLSVFGLASPWVLFLTRKVLGYCILKKEGAAALLLSCLRDLAGEEPAEAEDLILDYFLVNYPTAIELFEAASSPDDVAADSVGRLRAALDRYLDGLRRHGTCAAFRPSERERALQRYQQLDFWRGVQDIAEEQSFFVQVAHRIPMLYGTALVTHVYRSPDSEPVRQEVALSSLEHTANLPRLDAMDPVGLQYARFQFKRERPPS